MTFTYLLYLLVPVAFVLMMKDYQHFNWIWLGLLLAGLFLGIAPYVALAYLTSSIRLQNPQPKEAPVKTATSAVTYHPDGSYTVYQAVDAKPAPSTAKTAFRVVGGLIAGTAIAAGLLFVGIIILFMTMPSIACGGSSKCY